MTELRGEKIVLREYKIEDAEGWYQWLTDPDTTIWMGRKFRNPKTSIKSIKETIYKIVNNPSENFICYAIADKETRNYLGSIDIIIDWIDKNATLSIVIGKEMDRNKGYGKWSTPNLQDI